MRRKIPANERCGAPSLHVAVDVETRPDHRCDPSGPVTHLLWFGKAVRWRQEKQRQSRHQWCHFTEPRQFWDWLYAGLDDRKLTWVWAHFTRYDLPALQVGQEIERGYCGPAYRYRARPRPDADEEEQPVPEGLLCTHGPPTILDLECEVGRRFVFLDLMNFLPHSLAEIGRSVGIAKPPDPGDEAGEEYWLDRCEKDVRIVQAAVGKLRAWQIGYDLGNLRYTSSSQSLAMWSHGRRDCDITWGHDDHVKAKERECYYPGKLRANRIGRLPVHAEHAPPLFREQGSGEKGDQAPGVYRIDTNSCYPHVMRGRDYPVRWIGSHLSVPLGQVEQFLHAFEACALVTLRSRERAYPMRTPKGVSWRVGTIRTHLAGPELRSALALGHVLAVHEMHTYQRGRPFDTFVRDILQMRDEARQRQDKVFEKLAKHVGNSLHGKLAQWSVRWRLIQGRTAPEPWGTFFEYDGETGKLLCFRSIGYHVEMQMPREEQERSFPLIAAYVSSYARLHVQAAIDIAGADQVYYQDVDSLHVGAVGFQKLEQAGLIHPHEAGKWKVEATARDAEWRGPKNYRFDDAWTISGVSPHAHLNGRGILCQTNFVGLQSYFAGPPGQGPVTLEVAVPECVPHLEGTIGEGGWLVYPVEGC